MTGLLGTPYMDPIYGICHAISSAAHVAPCCAHEWDRTIHVFSLFFNYFGTKPVGKPTIKVFAAVLVAPAIVALTRRTLALKCWYTIPWFEGFWMI